MKRILLSAGSIAFVAALVLGVTGAFFSDQEKSTGNTFTAGTLNLQVDSTSHYDGLICKNITAGIFHWVDDPADPTPTSRPDLIDTNCDGTWTQKDLGPSDKFFNFTDVKPGDNGEDTISLHVSNNAWICANITTTGNAENGTSSPEVADGDSATLNGPFDGELAQNTFVFGWVDNASTSGAVPGDNKWQAGETVLFQPTALSAIQGGGLNLPLADSQHGSALIASTTNYFGVAWCTGTIDVSVPGTVKCDGSTLGNKIQTDQATADITLAATQSRNNPSFLCGQATSTPGGLVVTKQVVGTTSIAASAFTIHVKTLGNADAKPTQPGPVATFSGLASSTYIVTENGPPGFTTTFSAGCSATSTPFAGGAVVVTGGATSTCTITNTDPGVATGTLHITKVRNPGVPNTATTSFSFILDGGAPVAFEADGTNDVVVTAGPHTVTETAPAGYAASYGNSLNANTNCNALAVPASGNVTCTVTNTPTKSTITVDKIVSFSSATIAGVDVTDFQLHITGPGGDQIVTDEVPATGLAPGVYTVSEVYSNNPPNITFNAVFSGDCSEIGVTNTGTMTVAAGESKLCTLTNIVSPALGP